MKKTMKNLAVSTTLALAALLAPSAARAVGNGDIYEFRPITAVNTAETAWGAATKIEFKMRLIVPNPKVVPAENRHQWQIFYRKAYLADGTPNPSVVVNPTAYLLELLAAKANSPLQLGITVSGQTRWCDLTDPEPFDADGQYDDITCTYVTKFGDLALPVKLAVENGEYVFRNGGIWGIGYLGDDGKMHELNATRFENPTDPTDPRANVPIPERPRNGSRDLAWGFGSDDPDDASKAYFVKTVGFDDQSYTAADATVYWRGVREGVTECRPDEPAIRFDAMPENPEDLYLYVWSENDDAVTLKFSENDGELRDAGVFWTNMVTRAGGDEKRDFWIRKIKVDGSTVAPTFKLKGKANGGTATLVLSATPYYQFHNMTEHKDLLEDFLTAETVCIDPPAPTVSVRVLSTNTDKRDTANVNPYDDVGSRIATLTVELTGNYDFAAGDKLTVTLLPKLAKDGVPGESALDYFGMSFGTETQSYLERAATNVVFEKNGEKTATVYVYGWGADAKTFDVNRNVAFVPSIADATAAAAFGDRLEKAFLLVKPMKPVVVEPVEEQLVSVNCSVPYALTVKVSDTYNDMKDEEGYELWYKRDVTTDLEPVQYKEKNALGNEVVVKFRPDADGYLYSVTNADVKTAHKPQITWENTATDTAELYLVSPKSGQKSDVRTIKLFVKPARQIEIVTTDGREGNQYIEGDDVNVRVNLIPSKQDGGSGNDTGDRIWVFLVPQGEATNAVSATWLNAHGKTGRPIEKGGFDATGSFSLLDGTDESDQGAMYDFRVELRTKQNYSEGELVPGFESKTLTIYSKNVVPHVKEVSVNSGIDKVKASGGALEWPLARNVTNEFELSVADGSKNKNNTYDITVAEPGKRFKTRWRVLESGSKPKVFEFDGNPNTNVFRYAFTKVGKATVEVTLQDKDMGGEWGDGEIDETFTFTVDVIANPVITVSTTTGVSSFMETDSLEAGGEASIDVKLSLNPVDQPLQVELTVVPPSERAADNPGVFELMESVDCKRKEGADNVYLVTFDATETMTIGVKSLDGTALSRTQGFTFRAKVLGALVNGALVADYPYPDVPGETCASYYRGVDTVIKVANVAPQVDIADLYPQPETTNKVAIGVADAITWSFTDVTPDFTNALNRGVTVTVKGGVEAFETNVTSAAGASGSFAPTFKDSGVKIVTLTFKDKDNGSTSFLFYYEVAVSKTLIATPHGPTGGRGTAYSKRYQAAAGLGEGHVYGGAPASASIFESTYNCQMSKRWTVWGFGYKVGAVDDGTLDKGLDFPLTTAGSLAEKNLDPSAYYRYPTYLDRNGNPVDSFLYTWLQVVSEEESSTLRDELLGGGISPEYAALAADTGTTVGLPTELLDDGTYDDAMLEAIFSLEYLASDNMGDINQDGVPDVYISRYGFGVLDTMTGEVSGDDLVSLAGYNADAAEGGGEGGGEGDYLPGDATAFPGVIVSGERTSWAKKFTADLEIRGFGPALNDAPRQLGIAGVKPDLIYGNPDPLAADYCPSSTLSQVEYLAWSEYAAANLPEGAVTNALYFSKWSPERPTDPTKIDTDEDGFEDGFEYYYWYLAHVGYMDGGVHRYLTGRRYDPRNPGEGRLITSAEIAAVADPLVKYTGGDADTRDSDNDGIPDLLEFELGTNPFDFDSDGDGLPDGWELMIAGTDPTKAYTTQGISDAMRNYDGDAMAFTTPKLERTEVLPKPLVTPDRFTFALAEPNGDSDGVQWYVGMEAPTNVTVGETGIPCVSFKVGAQLYVTAHPLALAGKFVTADGRLAVDLEKDCTWEALPADAPALSAYPELSAIADDYVRLMPVRLAAGTPVADVVTEVEVPADPEAEPPAEPPAEPEPTTRAPTCATLAFDATVKDVNAAWIYGRANVSTLTTGAASANLGGFGMLAVGRNQDATNSFAIAALPKADENVAYVHYLVYQEFGFDPRTAWNANTPLAARWGSTEADGSTREGSGKSTLGYAGTAARTREYTTYDEFLVYSFFLNNGANLNYVTVRGPKSPSLVDSWFANTTNPQGPGEPDIDFSTTASNEGTEVKYYGRNSDNGADTDMDGVPDGWELYIMAGPKQAPSMFEKEKFFFVAPYGDDYSVFSPFVADAAKAGSTDVFPIGDSDGASERQEYAGTDSCNYYSVTKHTSLDGKEYVYSDTIVRPEEHAKWLNKFFPTDPWNTDTDGDGIDDGFENKNYVINGTTARFNCANFIYGEPADDGKLTSIPGGGLNPCSVDTDQDGLPDAWEAQFAGNPESLYKGEFANYVKDEGGQEAGNALQGLTDGMDGTVKDAYNYVFVGNGATPQIFSVGGVAQVVDRDYDHDGLDNWQEYLTSAMRCWRYDDPYSVWQSIPNSVYYDEDGIFNPFRQESLRALGIDQTAEDGGEGEFWYKTLVDKTSPIYNPHLVTDTGTGSQYYTRVWNGWDPNWKEQGAYYIFHHRIGKDLLINFWGNDVYEDLIQPWKYISCSPIKADTDGDGMDDYYELFHGLNPLLGEVRGVSTGGGMVDVVYDAWVLNGSAPFDAEKNIWTENAKALLGREPRTNDPKNNKYDFELFPWLAGLPGADADGDDLRNQSEAIMAMLAPEAYHTDPSALWLTDSSYTNSLVSRFYRLPATYTDIVLQKNADGTSTFTYDGQTYAFTDCDGFYWDILGGAHLAPFTADHWSLTSVASKNWFVSFEENEGFDTDHDGISDFEELQARPTGTVSDPQEADSPHRRQAMYFPGENAALQTMPFVREEYPRAGYDYQDDRAFLEYTVECWVRPEDVSTVTTNTVIERAIWSSYSAAGDEELLRKNFQLGIRNGRWYTKFDANGTLKDSVVELQSEVEAKAGEWTHLAATYDGAVLRLYVNGTEVIKEGVSGRGLTPEYGASAVIVRPGEDLALTNGQYAGREDKFWKDSEYPLHAVIIGASAKSQADFGGPTKISKNHLDVMNGRGWSCYKDFFKGYVDEVRVWDGARTPDKIKEDMTRRYTATDAKANRDAVYAEWSKGLYRYDKVGRTGAAKTAELRFHWSFDSLPAAENAEMVAKQAHGYGYLDPSGATQGGAKAPLGRPADYEIAWWKKVLDGYTGTVYGNPAYVTWVPNTVTHLPRFDGTTLDSAYWAEDAEGTRAGSYSFANSAEPAARWTQYVRKGAMAVASVAGDTHQTDYGDFKTTSRRFSQVCASNTNAAESAIALFEFTGRHLNQQGDDLLPLGGAFVKYVDGMWDEEGPSTASEITGTDDDNNGLADWWEAYAKAHYAPESEPLTWKTYVTYGGKRMTAGEAYLLDLAKGFYADKNGNVVTGDETYQSRADEDHDGMPDWWELVNGIHTGDTDLTAGGHANADPDRDGLSNYQEYLAGLNPSAMKSDGFIVDYFRRGGGTYLGAKYTDHDMVDDLWEDKWLDPTYASHKVWDALNDADGDSWSLFAERRYMSYKVNGMANLVSHLVGANETPDMPMPTVKMTVRYNGNQLEIGPKNAGAEGSEEKQEQAEKQEEGAKPDEEEKAGALAPYYVYAYADRAMTQPNAVFKVEPGTVVSKTLYIGGWEDRVVHGTLAPGHVDFSTLDLEFAQVQQADRYSWSDANGNLNLAKSYAEFKAALLKDPEILQNVQSFEWLHLTAPWNGYGVASDKAITVSRVENEQKGYINLYGERIGTIDLETGEFSLDMGEIVKTATPYTFGTTVANAWSYKEGVFRLTYKAVVPALNRHETTFSLAKADEGYIHEGKNSFLVFSDINDNGVYDVGEPFGVVRDVDVGWDQVPELTVELTDKPVIETDAMPRVMVAENGTDVPVTIVRTAINGEATIERTVLSRKMDFSHRGFFTEQDVLRGRMFDLDWANLLVDAENEGIAADQIESATYQLQVGNGEPVTFTRAFAPVWKAPLAVSPTKNTAHVLRAAQPTFVWDGDDNYTAFEIEVADANDTVVWTSGVRLMPAEKEEGRSFTAPVYAALKDAANKGEAALSDGETYKWRVAQFNAKFNAARADRARSDWAEFKVDLSAGAGYGHASVDVRYYGSGNGVSKGDVVVGLYKTGDFTGAPVAAMRLKDGDIEDLALEPTNFTEPQPDNLITFAGVKPGDYYVMAFIDRNGNGVRDIFESWGYANRHGDPTTDDHYDPVSVTVADTAAVPPACVVFMEDTAINGTDLDCDRDLGELEAFVRGSLRDSDNDGLSDEEEEEEYFTESDDPDTDKDGMPDGWEELFAGMSALRPGSGTATPGDLMAYAEEKRTLVTLDNGEKYLLEPGKKVSGTGNVLKYDGQLWSCYEYGNAVDENGQQIYGLGQQVNITDPARTIRDQGEEVTVALVHNQVYQKYGYSVSTANAEAFLPDARGIDVANRTKAFTALDKYLVWAYLRAIGYTAETDENFVNWSRYTLKPGKVDGNNDLIADGWNLYVMFSKAGETAAVTPWTDKRIAWNTVTPGGEGLLWTEEYDNGHYSTDPWNAYTIDDRFEIDGVEYEISDKDAYDFHLKHFAGEEGDKYADFDNDGLVNYEEYAIFKNGASEKDEISPDEMFSYFGSVTVPTLAGQCVPDYFLKSTKPNAKAGATVRDYLGFDYSSHDFLESWWKDQYGLSRMTFDPYGDADGDGWDNWSEARARKDPTKVSQSAIEGYVIDEFPVPMISLSLETGKSAGGSNATIVVQARLTAQTEGMPDAVWNIGGRSAEAQEKFLGFNPGITKDYNLGGAIVPGSFSLCFKDQTADHETYLVNTNDSKKTRISSLKVSASENVWANAIVDTKIDNDSPEGYLVDRHDGDTIYGKVNYETGDVTVYFDRIVDDNGEFGAWRTWNEDQTECVVTYYWKSYVRANWTTRAASLSAATRQDVVLSDANEGQLRQGLNTFVAFADSNGNGAYDPGEPFGSVANVQVGWDKVVDLKINLTTTSPVMPRFDAAKVSGAAVAETEEGAEEAEGAEKPAATVRMIEGKPVITDVEGKLVAKVVRWKINDEDCFHRTVLTKYDAGVVTEADVLGAAKFDLDWKTLTLDAGKSGIGADAIDEVLYAVFAYDSANPVPLTEENVNGWIVKSFARVRLAPTAVAPTAADTEIVRETRPTFTFKAPGGYTAFAFELMDAAGDVVFSSVEHLGQVDAAGNATYRPPVYFGWDKDEDLVDVLLPNGTYTWHVAMLNAKYDVAGDWSADATFAVELAKGKVHDTDKGILDVTVRYYGNATVDAGHPIVVQAFKTADFTGVPEGQAVITDTALLNSYDNTNAVNAKIYGLPAGDYYVCAFVDTKRDVKRMRWESWGYRNNVGTDKADLYTPVATTVMRNDTSAALVFIEDMDCNGDDIPDALQPDKMDDLPWVWPWPEPPEPKHGGGGEEPGGGELPPWFPGAEDPEAEIPNDFMAYEDLAGVTLVRVGLTDEKSAWYAVMDLQNEGVKLRDSTIAKQTLARDIQSLVTTWNMGKYTGIGKNVVFTGDEKVWEVKQENIRLVHAQVYANNGFETGCAAVSFDTDPRLQEGIAAAKHPHTKNFTVADKYYFVRYLESIGVAGVSEKAMVAEIEKAIKNDPWGDPEEIARKIWTKYSLDPDDADVDQDSVADGWEAYVMFGITDLKAFTGAKLGTLAAAKISPFNPADGLALAPGAGSQLKLVEEFDGGYYPTDPWSLDTDRDSVIDLYAYQYHLKGGDAGKDFDLDDKGEWVGDGLSNYAEYLISEVFKYAKLDPEKVCTSDGVNDYFRKAGDLYLGEVFTDHDQVGDVWEGKFPKFANRYQYDPDRDDDNDGWSNYAEFRAQTNPGSEVSLGLDDYTFGEYPIPAVKATVVYNGDHPLQEKIVFKAWNEAKDAGMLGAPDAIWTLGASVSGDAGSKGGSSTGASSESGTALIEYAKYAGRNPGGLRTYNLTGGAIAEGSVKLFVRDSNYRRDGVDSNLTDNAVWYQGVKDSKGQLVSFANGETVGTVDYLTGEVAIDYARLTGAATGDASREVIIGDATKWPDKSVQVRDLVSLDDAAVLVKWSAKKVGTRADGVYYLADADAVTAAAASLGHLREGKATFVCFSDENGDGAYTAGEPYGVVRGVDVGWQGVNFTVELTEASPVFARVNLFDGTSDRKTYWGNESGDIDAGFVSNATDAVYTMAGTPMEGGAAFDYDHVRIVPYLIGGTKTDTALYDRDYVLVNDVLQNRVVAEFDVNRTTKPVITEADFIRDGVYDIDWDGFRSIILNDGDIIAAVGDVTAVKYRLVFGKEGPVGRESNLDEGTKVRAFSTLIERRYEPKNARTLPTQLACDTIQHGARPTFRWHLDEPGTVNGYASSSSLFGCSYTAFQIEIAEAATGTVVYDSGLVRTPAKNAKGEFVWTAPVSAGDQTALGRLFAKTGNWKWRVAMYNAKFKPDSRNNGWSAYANFSTAVDVQQATDDHNYSAIDVTVKYAGPELVLAHADAQASTLGKVRIQAFETADFSGEPVSQGFVSDKASLVAFTDVTANGRLIGLPAGTYFLRAYIDTNGNFQKDAFESWGYAKAPVTVGPGLKPEVAAIWIEDADTDQDWLPDAWEYEHNNGDLAKQGAKIDANGQIILKTVTYNGLKSGKANISDGLSGASLTFFEYFDAAKMLLGLGDDTSTDTIAAIRAAVEKNIVPDTLKISSLVVDQANKQVVLTVDADVADSIAGQLFAPVYTFPELTSKVQIKVYRKENLLVSGWGDPLTNAATGKDYWEATIDTTLNKEVPVPVDINWESGFYKVEVVQ